MRQSLLVLGIGIIFCVRIITYEKYHVSLVPQTWFETQQMIIGVVVRDPDRGLTRTRMVVKTNESGKFLVTAMTGTMIDYGDRVKIIGTIQKPASFETVTGRMFDYPKYLSVDDIYATVRADTVEILDHHHGSQIIGMLFEIKKHVVAMIKQLFSPIQAALLAGIMVGEQSLFPSDALDSFRLAGLTHMIVLSGYNITIVMTLCITIFARLGFGYRARRIGGIIAIPLFIIMTGMGTSLVRTGIMAMSTIIIQITTRPAHNFRVLVITAGVMIFMNPRIFLYSPSFHLSFLAFTGLVYVVPLAHKKFETMHSLFGIRDIVVETVSIQLFVLPYILWMSGQVSLLSFIANIITIPIIPSLMLSGFVATLVGFVIPSLGTLLAIPVGWGLHYILWVSQRVAALTSVVVTVHSFSHWWMISTYGILAVLFIRFHIKKHDSETLSKITNS